MYYLNEISGLRKDFYRFYDERKLADAITACDKMLYLYKDNNDTENLDYARDLYNLGVIYEELGAYDKALNYYQAADKIYKHLNNTEKEEYANLKNNIGVCLGALHRYDEAVNTHIPVLALRERLLGRNHADCVESLINMGNTYADMKKNDRALDYLTKALSRADRNGNIMPMEYSDILCSLARVNAEKGNYIKSIGFYSKAIDIIEKETPKGSRYFVKILNAAGRVCTYAEKYEMAALYYSKSLDIRKKLDETDNVDYIMSLNNLALAYGRAGNMEKSDETFEKALKEVSAVMSRDHVFYGDVLVNKAFAYSLNGDTDMAIRVLEQALSLKERTLGGDNEGLLTVLSRLARENAKKGEFKKAEDYCVRILDIAKKSGEIHKTASAHKDFAHVYMAERDYTAAEEQLLSALKLYDGQQAKGKGEIYFNVLSALGYLMTLKGNLGMAEKYAGRVLAFREVSLGNRHPKYAYALYRLAEIQLLNGKFDMAIPNIERAMEICADTTGKEYSRYAKAADTLKKGYAAAAQYYLRQGDKDKALENYVKMYSLGGELSPEADIDFAGLYIIKDDTETAEKIIKRYKNACPYGDKSSIYENWIKLKDGDKNAADYLYANLKCIFEKDICFDLGEYFYKNGDVERACEFYRNIMAYLKNEKYLRAVYVTAALEKSEEAEKLLKRAKTYGENLKIDKTEEYIDVCKALADIYYEKGEYENACECYEKVILYGNEDYMIPSLKRMGKACAILGKNEDAVEFFSDAALKIKVKNGETAEFASLLAKTGKIYMDEGNYDKALTMLKKAESVFEAVCGADSDKHILTLLRLAKCVNDTGDGSSAVGYYEKAYNACIESGKTGLIDKDSLAAMKGFYKSSGKLDKIIRIKMGKTV